MLGIALPDGSIGLPRAASKDKTFIISFRSEEALRGALVWKGRWLWCGATFVFLVGIGLLVAAYHYW